MPILKIATHGGTVLHKAWLEDNRNETSCLINSATKGYCSGTCDHDDKREAVTMDQIRVILAVPWIGNPLSILHVKAETEAGSIESSYLVPMEDASEHIEVEIFATSTTLNLPPATNWIYT